MGYAMNEYARDLSPEERREKALGNAVSWYGQWQWYEIRRPVLYALVDGQRTLDENRNRYLGAKVILNFLLDMTDSEIEDYCKAHVDWLLDDHAFDDDLLPMGYSPWVDGKPVSVTSEEF